MKLQQVDFNKSKLIVEVGYLKTKVEVYMKTINVNRLGSEPIGKLLFSMSSQTTLALLVYSFYSLTDVFFISRGVGPLAAAGVSISSPLLIALGAVSTTVGAGGASVVSRALGEKDAERASRTVANAFMIFWTAAILVTVFGLLFLDKLTFMMGATESIAPYAMDYGRVILIGAITSTGYSAIVRADGNIKFSTAMWLIPVGINIVLDPLFIFGFKLEVTGAAIATVVAQAVSACMSIYFFFFRKGKAYDIKVKYFKPQKRIIKEIIAVGLPSFLKNISSSVIVILINNLLKNLGGDSALSIYAIVGKLFSGFSTPQVGIMQGMQPVVGYNYGLKAYNRVKKTVKLSIGASVAYGLLACILCMAFPALLISIMSDDSSIISSGTSVLRMMSLAYPLAGVVLMISAYFQAVGKASKAVALSFGGILAVRIPVLLIMSMVFDLNGIWLSEVIAEIVLCIVSVIMLRNYQQSLV
jgi:putative MATE family efflux protein